MKEGQENEVSVMTASQRQRKQGGQESTIIQEMVRQDKTSSLTYKLFEKYWKDPANRAGINEKIRTDDSDQDSLDNAENLYDNSLQGSMDLDQDQSDQSSSSNSDLLFNLISSNQSDGDSGNTMDLQCNKIILLSRINQD